MASPQRSYDRPSSSQRSTPSRNFRNSITRINGYHQSPNGASSDSPSRQILEEFSRMLIHDERTFTRSLDEQSAAQQKLHLEALDRALARHEEVRESAERMREKIELELEKETRRRQEEERKAVEKARKELAEQQLEEEKRRLEEARAREEENRKRDLLRRQQEEQKQRLDRLEKEQAVVREEEERRKKEEAARKAREEATPAQSNLQNGIQSSAPGSAPTQPSNMARTPTQQPNGVTTARSPLSQPPSVQTPATASQPTTTLPIGLVTSQQEREIVHKQYLELHRRLKGMRQQVSNEVKGIPNLKNQLSDWRRAIVKCCGQLGKGTSEEVKAGNRRALAEIVQHLDAAASVSTPSIDVTQYLVQNNQPPGANKQGPACLVFLLNHFAKKVISQFISESAVDPKSADPIGVIAVTVFARPQYLFNGQSLIDLLWAKYHVHCPVLFGISGSERTKQGHARLGWKIDKDSNAFASEQEHYDRMSGLGVGFAAITLRDFSKSKNSNPAPNRIYWQSLARIINTPSTDVQPTHFVVLKAMIADYVPRIIATFGGAGAAVLRTALITFPNEKGPADDKGRKVPAVTAVQAMPMVLQRDLHLTL